MILNILKRMFSNEGREKDPICGMSVVKENAQFQSVYKGKNYYFCSGHCKKQFDEDPEQYIGS